MVKKINIGRGKYEDFEVINLPISVGDTIWFIDSFENCKEGVIIKIDPDHWWIYEDEHKALGCVEVEVAEEHCLYQVDFCDVLLTKPNKVEEFNKIDVISNYAQEWYKNQVYCTPIDGFIEGYKQAVEKICGISLR